MTAHASLTSVAAVRTRIITTTGTLIFPPHSTLKRFQSPRGRRPRSDGLPQSPAPITRRSRVAIIHVGVNPRGFSSHPSTDRCVKTFFEYPLMMID